MALHDAHGTFVSEKVNKIRWRPDFLNESTYFVTGSWDNYQNTVKLWNFQANEDAEVYPYLITEHNHQGDVTEIQFLNQDNFVTSSSKGSVNLLKITSDYGCESALGSPLSWDKIHQGSCTGLALYDNNIVSVGEDGQIILLAATERNIIRRITDADSCSIACVIFIKHDEILTGNLLGQMKIWDLRSQSKLPTNTFMLSTEQITPTCLQYHPTQRHLVVAGDEEGTMTIWDLRKDTSPVNMLSSHDSSIMEIQFHPDYSDHLFSCSAVGDIWHWAPKNNIISSLGAGDSNVLLTARDIKNKLELLTLMPQLHKSINSLHLNKNKILCGCDNEAFYLINCPNIFQ